MISAEEMQRLTEVLMDMLIERPPSAEEQQDALTSRIVEALEEAGFSKFSNEELTEALDRLSADLTAQHNEGLAGLNEDILGVQTNMGDLVTSLSSDFDANLEAGLQTLTAEQIAPLRNYIANMPEPVITQVTHRTTVVHEGDQVVDQSIRVRTGEGSDVQIEAQNTVSQADDASVAVAGDVGDSAINTGDVQGIMTGSGHVSDSVVGDDNLAVMNSEIGAMSSGGDAVVVSDIDGNANVGGMQAGIEAEGNVNSVIGDSNDVAGDQSVELTETVTDDYAAMEESFEAEAAAADAEVAELEADFD